MTDRIQCRQRIAIAIVERIRPAGHREFLVGTRSDSQTLAGLDEFPGGKVVDGETPAAAAVRECGEESSLVVSVVEPMLCAFHAYDHGSLELHFFRCGLIDNRRSTPQLPFRWVSRDELLSLNFPEANQAVLRLLVG